MIVQALPLGLGSILGSAYFMLDLVLIGFLVPAHELGYYAAAVKILSILSTVPGLVMTAALAALSSQARTEAGPGVLASRLWHWLLAVGAPACLMTAVFAEPVRRCCSAPSTRRPPDSCASSPPRPWSGCSATSSATS